MFMSFVKYDKRVKLIYYGDSYDIEWVYLNY